MSHFSATEARPGERTATPEKLREELLGCVPDYRREVAAASRLDKFKAAAKRAGLVALAVFTLYGIIASVSYHYRKAQIRAERVRRLHQSP